MCRNTLKTTFDSVAERYDRARPGYPTALFDDLGELAGLAPGSAILEIACGTGKATQPMAERGYRVTAVEIGAALADVARRVLAPYPNVEITTGAFESWVPARTDFDAIVCATAWHWLDPATRYLKAAGLLRPGGSLAIVSTDHVVPEADGDPFFREIQATYEALGETRSDEVPSPPEKVPDRLSDDVERSGAFERPTVRRYVWEQPYTADQYIEVLNTYSNHIAMAPTKRARLDAEVRRLITARPDGLIRKHYMNWLHLARRLSP
jgi:SAM-dependent methyltransferase